MNLTIMVPNVTGMIAGAYYSYKFVQNNSGQFNLTPYYAGTAASIATVTGMLALMPADQAQNALGYLGCVIVVAMFSGPLAVIKEVIETKSTKSLPFPMAVATVVNCTLWGAFGSLVVHDPFIWAPNFLGLSSGLAQLALFAKYGFHKEVEAAAAPAEESKAE
jgi:solute carrier family 50 protein (sugar transporter)